MSTLSTSISGSHLSIYHPLLFSLFSRVSSSPPSYVFYSELISLFIDFESFSKSHILNNEMNKNFNHLFDDLTEHYLILNQISKSARFIEDREEQVKERLNFFIQKIKIMMK